jgi:hypothetical protein
MSFAACINSSGFTHTLSAIVALAFVRDAPPSTTASAEVWHSG